MLPTEFTGAELNDLVGAQEALRQTGILIGRKVFASEDIAPLLDSVQHYVERLTTQTPLTFPAHFRWLAHAHACDLTALDPNTAGGNDEFCETSLFAALMTPPIERLLRAEITDNAGYAIIRTRTILPKAAVTGSLGLHMEKTAVRFPGLYVIWTPLVPAEVVANVDAPGIEFRCRDGSMYRPELTVGDIAIFTGEVEHGTYIPPDATHWRAGCDIRLFPWSEENLLPPESIAMGQRPHPLRWQHH